jgi:hypothetical protein
MRREPHLCSVPGCRNFCLKQFPFCAPCWRKVPRGERAEVVEELANCTGDEYTSALRLVVTAATRSVRAVTAPGPGCWFWEMAYHDAGRPEL